MRLLATALAALALIGVSPSRAEAPRPILVVVLGNVAAKTEGNMGLVTLGISAWANHFVNKDSAVKVERFLATLGDVDFGSEATGAFACVAIESGCERRSISSRIAEFDEALLARPDQEGVLVELLPEMLPEQMLMRAAVHYVKRGKQNPKRTKVLQLDETVRYVAVFTRRAPPELAAQRKTNPAALEQFWTQGEPRRLVSDFRFGLSKLNELIAMLIKDGHADGKMPEAWKSLPRVKEIKKSRRVACSGPAWCASTYVLADEGESFVLVSNGSTAGWFDAAAAAKETNLPFMAMLGIPGN